MFLKDPGFSLLAGDVLKDVRALAVTPTGMMWIASNKTKSAVSYDPAFKLGGSLTAEDPQTLSISPLGEVVFASKLAVKVGSAGVASFSLPSEKPGVMEIIDRIGAATILVSGDILVSDLKHKRRIRFPMSIQATPALSERPQPPSHRQSMPPQRPPPARSDPRSAGQSAAS